MKATHRLSDLRVDYVSLVSRSAVRDPSNPTEPMRFLLRKADTKRKDKIKKRDPGGSDMGDDARQIKKFEDTVAELRKTDPTLDTYDAMRVALRKHDDVRALQDAYLEAVNPQAAALRKADREVLSVGAEAAAQLRKSADEIRRPGQSDYDAMREAIRRNPGLVGGYREVA